MYENRCYTSYIDSSRVSNIYISTPLYRRSWSANVSKVVVLNKLLTSPARGSPYSCSSRDDAFRFRRFVVCSPSAKVIPRFPARISLCKVFELHCPIFVPYCCCANVTSVTASLTVPTSLVGTWARRTSNQSMYITIVKKRCKILVTKVRRKLKPCIYLLVLQLLIRFDLVAFD